MGIYRGWNEIDSNYNMHGIRICLGLGLATLLYYDPVHIRVNSNR